MCVQVLADSGSRLGAHAEIGTSVSGAVFWVEVGKLSTEVMATLDRQ